ncbi:MAG: hypothetical protein ACOCQG_00190 [Candidatus Nanoarchaeia archaeon]
MSTKFECFQNISYKEPEKKINSLPQLPENFVAYYPGSGQDKRLCSLFNEMDGTVIYQDPIYKEESFRYSGFDNRLIAIPIKVKGDEKIEADIVYIDSLCNLLFKDSFVENVCNNSKQSAI